MAEYFEEVGPCGYGFDGLVPLTFAEVKAWVDLTAMDVRPWEASMVVRMSKAYCQQHSISDDPMTPPPFTVEKTEEQLRIMRERAQARIKKLF